MKRSNRLFFQMWDVLGRYKGIGLLTDHEFDQFRSEGYKLVKCMK